MVWKALASKGMEACVISSEKGKLIIPDHNNVMVPFEDREEAYYFCAIVNSKLIGGLLIHIYHGLNLIIYWRILVFQILFRKILFIID